MKKNIIIASLFLTIGIQSCKKSENAPESHSSNPKNIITGNWLLSKIKVTVFDQNSTKLSEDSLVSVKGYTDEVSFNEKGFKINNSHVPYEVMNIKNENFIKYTFSDDTYTLKIKKINPELISLDDIKLTTKNSRITQYYYQKTH